MAMLNCPCVKLFCTLLFSKEYPYNSRKYSYCNNKLERTLYEPYTVMRVNKVASLVHEYRTIV